MKQLVVLLFGVFFFSKAQASEDFKFYGNASTVFPVFAGAGLGMIYQDSFDLKLMYGFTPEMYYSVIGQVAASQGGNDSYDDVIESAFQNNSQIRIDGDYYFNTAKSGWLIGGSYSLLRSNGQAGIDQVLAAATGKDYTALKNLLTAAGRSTQVDMDSTLNIAEIHFGYNWNPYENLILSVTGGIAKVMSSDIDLKTGLPNFEASQVGSNLMRQSESDLEGIVNDYGISPTLGLNVLYPF